jgi:uncharacterized membrane protein HdeD (DUF308 family)
MASKAIPTSTAYRPAARTAPQVVARESRWWWAVLLSGIGWILVSAIVFRFDYASVLAVAILFGCVAIGAGATEFALAALTRGWWRVLHALLGVVFTAVGVVAFFTPGGTFDGLAAVISFYFIFAGTWDLASAVWTRKETSAWWVQALSGLILLALGFWAAGYWQRSAVLLVAFVGAMALMRGIVQLVLAFRLYELHHAASEADAGAAAPAG